MSDELQFVAESYCASAATNLKFVGHWITLKLEI